MASGGSTYWFFEICEDRCIYLIREAKRFGKVAAVRHIKETTERPALVGIQLFNENKQRGLRFDRFKPDANDLSKIFSSCSGCAQFADTFTKSVYPHINTQTGVYSPPCENTDPSCTRKRLSTSCQPKSRKRSKQSETTVDDDLEESLKSRYQGQFNLPIKCMKAPSTSHAVRQIDPVFVEHLKAEMVANPTTDVAPMIGLLTLNDGEIFDRLHPEAYSYETLGGNNSRTALTELCNERQDLAADERYVKRTVSIYVNLTDKEAQYLAIKHNRQQSFVHKMITQDKVHLCRLKLMNGRSMTNEAVHEMPETTTNWRDDCSRTLMTTKTQLINNMIFFLASLPPASYTALQEVYRKYEEAKKTTTKHSKPDCRGSNFRELRNLDDSTVLSMLQQVARGDGMLGELNQECKRLKNMMKLKEAFKNEVGEHSWEEAAHKYPNFASEAKLSRFSGKLEGTTLTAFQQYCRSAIASSTGDQQNTTTHLLSKAVDGQMFQCHHIRECPNNVTFATVSEALPTITGLTLIMCRFAGEPSTKVEQLLRTVHSLNRGAGLEGYVVCTESSPQEIGGHIELLERMQFSTEIVYWKNVDENGDSDGTIFVNAVTPFIIGVIRKEIVMVRVGEKSRCNMIEGGQKDFYETMVCSLTVPNDWILNMDPFNGIEKTITSILGKQRNVLLVSDTVIAITEEEVSQDN